VSDNLGWKAMALVADSRCLHCSQIRRNRDANNNRAVNVTSPDSLVAEAKLETARLDDAARARQEADAALHDLRRESRAEEAKLSSLAAEAGRAVQRLATAIERADAVELGVNLVATDVLRINIKKDERPELAWGEGAPSTSSTRIGLLEAIRPAEPILLRIARTVTEIVRLVLKRERRKLADDAAFVMSLNDKWTEEQRARLARISEG